MAPPKPECLAILFNPKLPETIDEAQRIADRLAELGKPCSSVGSLYDEDIRARVRSGSFDLLIALGGDGSVLRAAHLALDTHTPILGINMGHFGFLTELDRGEWYDMLPRLINGGYRIEERLALRAEQRRGSELLGTWDVINEVVLCRGQFVRPLRLTAYADGHRVAVWVADGIIASTPTGSTAYALAAGGPIMPPDLHNILLVAVAPHLSPDRAVILSEGTSVMLSAESDHQAVMSVDGQEPILFANQDTLLIQAGDHPVRFVRFLDPGYFYRTLNRYMEQNPSAAR
jgi:NAD+ kinase